MLLGCETAVICTGRRSRIFGRRSSQGTAEDDDEFVAQSELKDHTVCQRAQEVAQELMRQGHTYLAQRMRQMFAAVQQDQPGSRSIHFAKRDELIVHLHKWIGYLNDYEEYTEQQSGLTMELRLLAEQLLSIQESALYGVNNANVLGVAIDIDADLPVVTICSSNIQDYGFKLGTVSPHPYKTCN